MKPEINKPTINKQPAMDESIQEKKDCAGTERMNG